MCFDAVLAGKLGAIHGVRLGKPIDIQSPKQETELSHAQVLT